MHTRLRKILHTLFGDITWEPPLWPIQTAMAVENRMLAHRRATLGLAVAALALLFAAEWMLDWYRHRPVPQTITVRVTPPEVPSLKDPKQLPLPLVIRFGGSVAPMEQQGKVTSGISMEPAHPGVWKWAGDSVLVFEPAKEWPAATTYHIAFERDLFAPHVLLAEYHVEAKTPAFTAHLAKLEFYTNPKDPAQKQVVATVEFSHRVDPAEVSKHVQFGVVGGSELFPANEAPFTVTTGEAPRTLYVRTASLKLPEHEDFLRFTLEKGVATAQGGAVTGEALERKVLVPDLYSWFRIEKTRGTIVRDKDGEPEQIIFLETRGAAKPADLQKALHVYLLPKHKDKPWKSAEEVDEDALEQAVELPTRLVPGDKENSELHSFRISLETEGQLYVTVDKGVRALGGFVLGEKYATLLKAPEIPREVKIEAEGGVLALNGERKLSIKSRGVKTIEYEVARVPADQINHLVSQTRGEFQNPDFVNWRFGRENIARIATEQQTINVKSKFKANWSTFDFSKHLKPADDGGTALQGLFFLRAREWQPPKAKKTDHEKAGDADAADDDSDQDAGDDADDSDSEDNDVDEDGRPLIGDSRFILVTDLGLIVKEATDGGHDVFVASIKTGDPLGGVKVEILAKNGTDLLQGETAADGRVSFASLGKPTREKTPVAFVARRGNDVAFMPYAREDREIDYSKFDIGGVESRSGSELDAFVFTERGIYRPGDEIRIGLIVKQRDWLGHLEGLPIETEITDARGDAAQVRKLALPAMGFAETVCPTAYDSPSGLWHIKAFLVRHGKRDLLLGETSVTVKEFLPDRMKIESHLSKEVKTGWITPQDVSAAVTLRNLYGTPAEGRRVKAHLFCAPAAFRFDEFPGYSFCDRLREGKDEEELKTREEDLGEKQTDEQGTAKIDLGLERFAEATYAATFTVEGFEADSGRSVSTSNSLLVSPLPYVVGAKPDGDFAYVQMGSARTVEWIAVEPTLRRVASPALVCKLIEQTFVSVLTKQDDGNYSYESVKRDHIVRTEPLTIAAEGYKYALPTDVPGTFTLELREQEGDALVSRVPFTVVGRGAVTRSLEKEAELQVKLSRPAYNTGEEIEISIVAPYTGSGLITIERDKVYAHTWFKADRTSTVQHIRVPADFEGTGYINVCFVRALDSKEVFMSPLSYATASFQANIGKRRLPITLRAEGKHRPGEPLRIGYKTDRPSRIAVFAVDQGILQVSNYELPQPLAHFFRKAALMVQTKQIVDLIMPEFSILRHASAFGGDGEKRLNPFKRVTEKPVVFWSGILDAGPREQEVVYDVPDYFSGTLTIMAVAMAPDAVGSAQTESLVRGPFVLTPNVPVVAAPGDQFEVSLSVANGVEGSGDKAEVRVTAQPSEHLEIVRGPAGPVIVPEGHEVSATFTVRAKEKFGSASLVFQAKLPGQESRLRSTLSVRPAVPFMTSVRGGNFTGGTAELVVDRTLHPDFRKLEATLSALPLGLARGLDFYLQHYPNGCSEQLSSGAFCRLMLSDETDFGLSRREVSAQLERTFATLRQRQNDQGAFGYWTVEKERPGVDFISVYVMHFLIEAKAAGFAPPAGMIESGLKNLQEMVAVEPGSLRDARTQAWAAWLLTREGVVTTNYVLNLRDYLEHQQAKKWTGDLAAVYLAGSYALLKKQSEAERMIKGYKLGSQKAEESWDFQTPLAADAQYVAMVARHFPETMKKLTAADLQAVTKPIGNGDFSTISAAWAVVALKSWSHFIAQNAPELGLTEIAKKGETPLHPDGSALLKRALFSANATKLRFSARNLPPKAGAFYQVLEAGYDVALPDHAVADGLEVFREIVDAKGAVTHTAKLGDPVTVRLRLRSLRPEEITNVAIVDLLPGGFEMAANSLQPGAGSAGFDFVEVREDRAVFFGTIGPRMREVTYQIKPTNRGEFVVPPAFAESMYERGIKACALPSKITVTDAK